MIDRKSIDFVSFRFISISFIKNSSYDIDIQGIMSLFYFSIIIIQKSEIYVIGVGTRMKI